MKLYFLFSLTLLLPTIQIQASKPAAVAAESDDVSMDGNTLCRAVFSTDSSSLETMKTLLTQGIAPHAPYDNPREDIYMPKITPVQLAEKMLKKYNGEAKTRYAELHYPDLRELIPLFEKKVTLLKKAAVLKELKQKSSKS